MIRYLKDLILKTKAKTHARDSSEVEALRNDFKDRYHHFKLLLNANNNALEVMSEMEEALRGKRPFGMTHVRAMCTIVSTRVWQMASQLNELAPGKYQALFERFKEIRKNINPFLNPGSHFEDAPLVLPLKAVNKDLTDQVGSKMANIGEIKNHADLKVPNGFAVTASGYRRFMQHNELQDEIDRLMQSSDTERMDQLHALSADIQQLIIRSPLPEDLESAISEHYHLLEEENGAAVAVSLRSSALGEDFSETSFAGQYRSALNVSGENIHQVYKEIVASKYGLQAMAYRLNRGIRDEDVAMCVGCMIMVDAVSGGVVYSRNPIDIRDKTIVINSVWGLPKTVVDGSAPADLFIISRAENLHIIKKDIPVKEKKFVCYPGEGVCRMDVTGENDSLPSLTDEQALDIGRLAIRLEEYYDGPQDIEWAIEEDGSIIILQCRPLKQVEVRNPREEKTEGKEAPHKTIYKGGVTASPGVAAGPVFIIKKDMDLLLFPEGAVLVTSQAFPRWAAVLNQAAAVVTEHGSTAGHLANVAREFGVPALFGVEGAVRMLENESMITVDADGLALYKGRISHLLDDLAPPKKLMEGSPVFESLKGCAQHIVPLNLLNPDSPSFRPQNCKTFHDITRFCHEKAVDEMFRFGKKHHFPERSSKQLFCNVPMQWWVLNLDDGFKEEVKGRYIQLDNIFSIPMLALWEGIAAIPWEGPPSLDGKGFMSVMFEATTNTALTPGMRSAYASRNFFLISKNYCSLSSRLGFHFSTVEALVSERQSENYISFQFKGGAADQQRRLKRVQFVKEILEQYAFRVEIREDNLIARLEDRDMAYMKERLRILGYLIIHTRQLDMIMARDASVNYYREKIFKDIQHILDSSPEPSSTAVS
jgi:pyruvate, water dikinase